MAKSIAKSIGIDFIAIHLRVIIASKLFVPVLLLLLGASVGISNASNSGY